MWALEDMDIFKESERELLEEKAAKKASKKVAKKSSGKSDGKPKKSSKDQQPANTLAPLSTNAKTLKTFYEDFSYKDSLKYARKRLSEHSDIISFQMKEMHDRLPPLSKYNRKFKLEEWQCRVLNEIDSMNSTVVCAPTSSGKTLLSTYTCAKVGPESSVLFVLPSEVLVWQVAATYYQFFEGNVTICTDNIAFQDQGGKAQVYIGTPRALELVLTKARGIAGQEMVSGEREFMVLDGGFKFDYLVLDEVHTLNGPEGDSLQRIIKAIDCPVLALSATIGNSSQLQNWFQKVMSDRGEQKKVTLVEHYARFINLDRFVVARDEETSIFKLHKLHPVSAMTASRLKSQPDMFSALSMTPIDLMDAYDKLKEFFPDDITAGDSPKAFFGKFDAPRITLHLSKLYENRIKEIIAVLAERDPEQYEKFRKSFSTPPLVKTPSLEITENQLYETVNELKERNLLPAVAFQMSTFGAFQMFKTLLRSLELRQNESYPTHRADLVKRAKEKAALRKIAAGKAEKGGENQKEAEQENQAGFDEEDLSIEDIYQPHPKFVLSPVTNHLKFQEVEDVRIAMEKAGEVVDANHALIRGLRRGMAIYTNEVGFACYRRQVQILAQKGRLAVVFSDEALAYGVNMPFRSCIFCGHMGSLLTPLIAQQMQGRAGRRGMDVQGNIVYLGMDYDIIEDLMLGQISKVTGKNPLYPLMGLQRALAASNDPGDDERFVHGRQINYEEMSPQECEDRKKWAGMSASFEASLRHMVRWQHCCPTVSEAMMNSMTVSTLQQFCEDGDDSGYYEKSRRVLEELGYCEGESLRLTMDHNVLSMCWEISMSWPANAINIVACLPTLYKNFVENQRRSPDNVVDQNAFMACIVHIVDREECRDGDVSLQLMLKAAVEEGSSKVVDVAAKALYEEIEDDLRAFHGKVLSLSSLNAEEKELLKLELMDESVADSENRLGPNLDSGVYEHILTKRKGFLDEVDVARRNELKERIVKVGEVLRRMNNNIQQPHGKYRELFKYSNKCFSAVRYCVMDIMSQLTNQKDECEL